MNIRDTLLAVNSAGTLLDGLAALAYEDVESVTTTVSELHNGGDIDILSACASPQVDAMSDQSFFSFYHIFCKILPLIDSSVEAAEAACRNIFERAGHDLSAGIVYDSLTDWFRKTPGRVEEGLTIIHQEIDTDRRLVRPVLLAGASHDAAMYSEAAFDLSNQPQMHIRRDAIWALGRVVPIESGHLVTRAISRLEEVIDATDSDNDTAHAVEAALHLLVRAAGKIIQAVEPLILKASKAPTSATCYAFALGLLNHDKIYSPTIIDATFSALQHLGKQDVQTIRIIDSILYQWDLDGDRQRVLQFLINLLGHSDEAIDLDALGNFQHKLGNEQGAVLGWYVVSLLLTGNYRLCNVANQLLPYNRTLDGLDIDLNHFSLTSSWVLYLSRKILGYCIVKKESTAALLLSCLRAVSDADRAELEALIRDYFLMNYLTAIDWFEDALSPNDSAQHSVKRLSRAINSYVNELEQTGTCSAFRPSERERRLEYYRVADYVRGIRKKAEKDSLLSSIAHKSTLLYGTASIAYIYRNDYNGPDRQEIPLTAVEHEIEFPRMEVIDPVGAHYAVRRFRLEPPPS